MRQPRHFILLALAAAAAVIGPTACGSGGEAEAETPLTKAQFAKQATAICANAWNRKETLTAQFRKDPPKGRAEEEAAVLKLLAIVGTAAHELGQLNPPSEDAAEANAMVNALQKTLGSARRTPRLEVLVSIFETPDRSAEKLGLPRCRF